LKLLVDADDWPLFGKTKLLYFIFSAPLLSKKRFRATASLSPLKVYESESESQGHESESLKSGLESGLGLESSQHCIVVRKNFVTRSFLYWP